MHTLSNEQVFQVSGGFGPYDVGFAFGSAGRSFFTMLGEMGGLQDAML